MSPLLHYFHRTLSSPPSVTWRPHTLDQLETASHFLLYVPAARSEAEQRQEWGRQADLQRAGQLTELWDVGEGWHHHFSTIIVFHLRGITHQSLHSSIHAWNERCTIAHGWMDSSKIISFQPQGMTSTQARSTKASKLLHLRFNPTWMPKNIIPEDALISQTKPLKLVNES